MAYWAMRLRERGAAVQLTAVDTHLGLDGPEAELTQARVVQSLAVQRVSGLSEVEPERVPFRCIVAIQHF